MLHLQRSTNWGIIMWISVIAFIWFVWLFCECTTTPFTFIIMCMYYFYTIPLVFLYLFSQGSFETHIHSTYEELLCCVVQLIVAIFIFLAIPVLNPKTCTSCNISMRYERLWLTDVLLILTKWPRRGFWHRYSTVCARGTGTTCE